jgi:hypothetical protein
MNAQKKEKRPKKAVNKILVYLLAAFVLFALSCNGPWITTPQAATQPGPALDSGPNPPSSAVKLIFIHHSTGENWLNDENGGLGLALSQNNYFVSDTNYDWGPDSIGSNTDIPNWLDWFRSTNTPTYMSALYAESNQHSAYTRTLADPGGENEIIMFKSCFPNSALEGNPDDPPSAEGWLTVGHAKYVYNEILKYFETHPDKLFVVITAPPLIDGTYAANARAFNQWLMYDWLSENNYTLKNVAIFDFYNVLTGPDNHHRYINDQIEHVFTPGMNTEYYPSGDDHPSKTGNLKATDEFVPLLNIFYQSWKDGDTNPGENSLFLPSVERQMPSTSVLQPTDLEYLGAFRLPDDGDRPRTFAYGGGAMTYNPDGDASGPDDGFAGTLFIMGHTRMAYGELPDGNQVAEVSIPVPISSSDLNALNTAAFLQGFSDVAQGYFTSLDEIPRNAMLYLDTPATGPLIHLAWGQHFQEDAEDTIASHAWFSPDLSEPNMQGFWFIGNQSLYSVNGYMLEIPSPWADLYAEGKYIGTGRFKDGGWSGMGPALFAYRPWTESGAPAANGTHLAETPLLLYEKSTNTSDIVHALNGYQHADEWEGGAWLTTSGGKSAVVFAGNKGTGAKYWYGFINPAGPETPCVFGEYVGQFPVCRLADGTACPDAPDLIECSGHTSERGWWSSRFEAQLIFYDPGDLARVATGQMQTWEPQPYAMLNIDDHLFLNPAGTDVEMIGSGIQRRYRIGDVAYDRANGRLFVLELFADDAKPVVHVWQIRQP